MAKYIFKRILTAIPLIIVITILCFSLIHLAPVSYTHLTLPTT